MLKFTKDSYVDIEKYEENLRALGCIYVNKLAFSLLHRYECARRDTEGALAFRTMNADSGNRYLDMCTDNVVDYLVDIKHCPAHRFRKKGKDNDSLDAKRVLKPLYDSGYAREFLGHYMMFKSLKSKCGKIKNLITDLYNPAGVSNYDDEIYKIFYSVNQQKNLRYNYNNYDVIALPKEYNTGITVPKGYIIASGDFAQSDLRIAYNLYIRDDENVKIMDACEDKYEGLARIVSKFYGEEFDQERFKIERPLYKVYCLATIYGQRTGTTKEANTFITKLTAYLETCPRYVEYYKRIKARCDLGLPVQVTGYFGYTEMLDLNVYKPQDTINDALNSPNQMGTSQIIILTVNKILDMFYELGYTKEDICVYYVRHDEPLFIMKTEVLKDAWVFKQAEDIIVDNWTPLKLTFEYSYNYCEPNEELLKLAEKSYEDNKDRIIIEKPTENFDYEYYPIPKTLELGMIVKPLRAMPGNSVACFYNPELNKADYILIHSDIDNEILATAVKRLIDKESLFFDKGYRGVVIWSPAYQKEIYNGKLYYNFLGRMNRVGSLTELLVENIQNKVALREGKEELADFTLVNNNIDFINSVGDLNYVV